MKSKMSTGIALLATLAILPSLAPSQNRGLQETLLNATRVDCVFPQISKGDWPTEGPEFTLESASFTAAFFDIDVESGTAEAEGRFGASYIIVRYAEGYLHFMQTLNSGPLYLTTIFAQPASDGRLKAVHTRHEYTQVSLPGFTSRPEMYVGDCSVESAPQ
jgi:hypothetical protein